MSNFYTDVIVQSPLFKSPDECRDMMMLEPRTRAAVSSIIEKASKVYGITLQVSETYRSQVRQQLLFQQGATKEDGKTAQSMGVHHFGLACDFFKVINGAASWAGDWSFLRDLANKNGLISGLDWGQPNVKHTFIDPDHVQSCLLIQQSALYAGAWYPDSSLS
jgi:D-alanyl-D-alanine carboxypeptidase